MTKSRRQYEISLERVEYATVSIAIFCIVCLETLEAVQLDLMTFQMIELNMRTSQE